ncbi:NAD(P)-dependent dehydrogenase (short-subunit alcohol dehydrogenase family) [Rhodoligotrophos appendicifer]|uniref:glucose 1-dehydrogenase n=1 Tax=Rhodoligotrophos appendicifer TaxID=987056 RepID=UPI00118558E9|nr:glucose 1-dehydrogenase [Rhodoligotrophos appendicifer]
MTAAIRAADIFNLEGQVALVTGASSGLGWRFAKTLAANGAKVVIAARRLDRLKALEEEIKADGGEALAVALDTSDAASIPAAFDAAEKAFGLVTIVVNNAGFSGIKPTVDVTAEDWRGTMAVNLDGVWFVAQEAIKRLIAAKQPGSIINIASILGMRASKTLAAYIASKGGVIQLTRALAVEFARHKIRVNAIAPGYIETEMNSDFFKTDKGEYLMRGIPQRRIGDPSELDGVLLLLAAPKASSFITGSVMTADGGQSITLDH